jgi:hypothetical protein
MLCAVAFVGACSQETPQPAPSSSSSTTATATSPTTEVTEPPVAEPPALPPEATTPDAAGAAAFVRHWFDLVNYAYATGDTAPAQALSDPDCETCINLIKTIEDQYRDGGRIEGGQLSVLSADAPTPQAGEVALVTTRVAQAALRGISSAGDVVVAEPADPGVTNAVFIRPVDDGWRAAGIGEG